MNEITHLQFERERAGLNTVELAKLSGVTRQTIANIERGDDCKMSTAEKLCHALNCTSYDLFGF
jgi:DNA-binding XRE family transcriptional regulator